MISLATLSGSRRVGDTWVSGLAVVTACLVGVAVSVTASWTWALLVVGILGTSALSLLIWSVQRRRGDLLSPLSLIAAFYVASFVVGGVYFAVAPDIDVPYVFERADVATACTLAAVGLAALACGYQLRLTQLLPRAVRDPARLIGTYRFGPMVAILLSVGWGARFLRIADGRYLYNSSGTSASTGSSWAITTVSNLPIAAVALVGATYYLGKSVPVGRSDAAFLRRLFAGLVVLELAYAVPTATRAALLTIILMVIVVRYYGTGKLPRPGTMVATLLVVVLGVFPVLFAYRNSNNGNYQSDLATNFTQSLSSVFSESPSTAASSGLESTVSRFSSVTSLAAVLQQGTYRWGEPPGTTLSWTVTSLVPRAIVPDKPDPGRFGNTFGRSYAIIAPSDSSTSIAITQVAEMHANYGIAGVLIGMLIVGVGYRLLADALESRRTNPAVLGIYAAVAWPLANSQEALVASGMVGLVKAVALFVLCFGAAAIVSRGPSQVGRRVQA